MIVVSGLTEPKTDGLENNMDLVNECFFLCATYHLYQFTDFMTDLDNRIYVGYSFTILIIINVVLNFGLVVVKTASIIIRKIALVYMRWKAQKKARR